MGRRKVAKPSLYIACNTLPCTFTRLGLLTHLPRVQVGRSTTTHVAIPAEETKNGVPIELELPADTERLLSIYCSAYRPRLASTVGPYLFPNRQGEQRSTAPFAKAICEFILRETGIKMNVHLFRHFAVKLHLEAHPEDIETARRILGHKSTITTLRAYADLKTASAFRRYDALIANLRAQPAVPVHQRRSRRSGGSS
jgi:integrase